MPSLPSPFICYWNNCCFQLGVINSVATVAYYVEIRSKSKFTLLYKQKLYPVFYYFWTLKPTLELSQCQPNHISPTLVNSAEVKYQLFRSLKEFFFVFLFYCRERKSLEQISDFLKWIKSISDFLFDIFDFKF